MEMLSRLLLTFLLNSLWQVPLIAATGWLVSKMLSGGPASHKHIMWMVALFAALVVPLSSLRVSGSRLNDNLLPAAPASIEPGSGSVPVSGSTSRLSVPATAPIHVSLAGVTARALLAAYLLFLLFRLLMLCSAFVRTIRIRRVAFLTEPSPLLLAVWNRAAAAFVVGGAELRVSLHVSGPVTAGVWRPAIILPKWLLNETCEAVLTSAIGHEMAHLARHDYLLNLAAELISLPVAFQPAILLMRRAIVRSRELACDELVTRHLLDPAVYSRSIVTLAHDMAGVARPSGYSLGVFDGDFLQERIQRLVRRPPANSKHARILLATGLSALAVCVVVASGLAVSARAQSTALPEMKLAETAFNSGNFQGAVEHFQNAVNLDPGNVNARLFLATAIIQKVRSQPGIGVVAPNGQGPWVPVIQQYQEVLARDPGNQAAILGLATLGGPDLWQPTHERLAALISSNPANRAAYYMTGVMDWQLAFRPIQQAYGGGSMQMAGPIPDASARQTLRDKYQATIGEGVRMMQTALQLSPGSSDALAYLNLLYREAACLADTDAQFKDLMVKGDDLVKQALAAQRAQSTTQPSPAPLNVDGPPPSGMIMRAPPPPPPPPPGYRPPNQ